MINSYDVNTFCQHMKLWYYADVSSLARYKKFGLGLFSIKKNLCMQAANALASPRICAGLS